MTIKVDQGVWVWTQPLSVIDEPAFRLDSLLTTAYADPTLWIRTDVSVTGTMVGGLVVGVIVGLSWPEASGWLVIDTGASLTVRGMGDAQGFSSNDNWSEDVHIRGRLVVEAARSATGLASGDYRTFQAVNTGLLQVTGGDDAVGISARGLALNNIGTIEVRAATAYGVVGGTYAAAAVITNDGIIRATSTVSPANSVALSLDGWGKVANTGWIEGGVALRSTWEQSSSWTPFQTIINSGAMIGDLDLQRRVQIENSGRIVGDVVLSREGDVYDGRTGAVTGVLRAGQGDDSISGGAGAETFAGDAGADTLLGGAGDDVIGGGRDGDVLDGGTGFDLVTYADATMTVTLDLATGRASSSGEDTLSGFEGAIGGAFADTLLGGGGDDSLSGAGGRDYLRGGDGRDQLDGGAEFDDLHGNQGDDTVAGGLGDDWVVGGRDNDRLSGDEGGDIVYGNLGDDTCDGGSGADLMRGGQGADLLRGGGGDDWLSGDRGDDTVTGGAGADVFHTFAETGFDWVTDFRASEGDRVQLDPGARYTLQQVGADLVITVDGGGQMVLLGVQQSSLPAGWLFFA